jgi:hypothetical protein
MSNDLKATVLVTVLMIVLVTIPVLILRFTQSHAAEVHKLIAAWGEGKGLRRTAESALPPELVRVYSSVMSFVWKDGVLSVLAMPHRGGMNTTLWARPARGPAVGTAYAHARAFGSGLGHAIPEQPTGDAVFDGAFMVRGARAEDVQAIFAPKVRSALLERAGEIETFSWDGTRWSITLRGSQWDRGLSLIERVQSALR